MAKRGRVNIKPRFLPQEPIPRGINPERAREIMHGRMVVSMKNISRFYTHLYQAMYGGRVFKNSENHNHHNPLLNEIGEQVKSKFYPDVLIKKGTNQTFVEVKALSGNTPRPNFGFRQFSNYCQAFLENPYSEIVAGIFKYGGNRPEKLHVCRRPREHVCDNRCLVSKLANLTESLVIIPHNLLAFLCSVSPVTKRNQETSQSAIDSESYFRPFGAWLTLLKEHYKNPQEAIAAIIESKVLEKRRLGGEVLKPEDYMLQDLTALQYTSPNNLFCRNYHIKQFPVIVYSTPHTDEWRKQFGENLETYLVNLGIYQTFYRNQKQKVQQVEQPKPKKLPKKPDDKIPF